MTTTSKLAGAVLSAFLIAGCAEGEPVDKSPATTGNTDRPHSQQQDKQQCKQEKELTAVERRQILRGMDVGLCKDDAKKDKPAASAAPRP